MEEPQPTPEDEQMARALEEELAGSSTSGDYGGVSGPLYVSDSEDSALEPAHA